MNDEMNNNDMLIKLIDWLEKKNFQNALNVNFEELDAELYLTEGFSKQNIDAAAKAANLEVSIKGNASVRLLKNAVEEL